MSNCKQTDEAKQIKEKSWVLKILTKIFSLKEFKNLLFITKYKKLRLHEFKHWIFVIVYAALYFSIEMLAGENNIEFAVWDTVLTSSLLVLAVLIGNLFCGWACFMWRFQDVVNIVGRFIFRGRYNKMISNNLRNKLKWIKYIVFILTLGIPLILGSYETFLSMWGLGFSIGLFLCLFDSHAYCKYFCFIGSLFKIAGLLNKSKLVRDPEKCTDCKICSKVCLQDCGPADKNKAINRDLWCTSCFRVR